MSNFHESAADITVEDGHILKAVLNNIEGEGCEAEFDLSECIGNEDGEFVWGGAGRANNIFHIFVALCHCRGLRKFTR
jgi:hypothetical protein